MNLLRNQSKKDRILSLIEYNYGEISENEEKQILDLDSLIKEDVQTYGLMIVEKDFESRMDNLKQIKKEIDNQIKYLESEKNKIKYTLAKYLEEFGSQEVETASGTKLLKEGYTERRSINIDLVEPKYGKYIVELDASIFNEIIDILNSMTTDYDFERKVLLADLPDDHKAISKEMNPQIKLVKK